ncbi:MAG: hypothetical protein C0418_04565 [Coriobacteriaceae bacterium]|nr:hypothetical protein [Coriobacteriaceae bacterium]
MSLFTAALLVGLATSVHCVAMCGGLVLTYAVKDETDGPWFKRMLPHLTYQGAKITSYVLVGLALGSIGALLGLDQNLGGFRSWFTLVAAGFMVMIGLQMSGRFPALNRFTPRPPRILIEALSRTRRKAKASAETGKVGLGAPATLGLLTGFMPCAPLMAQQAAAAASGSPATGALIMLGFGLGTAPLMLGFGAVSGALSHTFKQRMMTVAAVAVILFGLVLLNRGLMLVGSPVTFNTVKQAFIGVPAGTEGGTEPQYATAADGVVEVPLAIVDTRFAPQTLRIPADKPVRLIVDRQEENACSAQIAVPQLGILQNLTPNGTTVVELPAAKAGAYTLTCGMGMMSGTLAVGAVPASGGSPLPWMLGAVVLFAALGRWASRRRGAQAPEPALHRPAPGPAVAATSRLTSNEAAIGAAAVFLAGLAGLFLGGVIGAR